MKNFKSSESRDGGRERSGGSRGGFSGGSRSGGFSGKSFGSGRGDFKKLSNRSSSFGSDRSEVTMHKTTCSECSSVCEVPFKPNGEKPVFCSNCFSSKREGTFNKDMGRDISRDRRENRDIRDERKGNVRELARRDANASSYSTPSINSNVEVNDLKKQIKDLNIKIDSLASVVDKFMVARESELVSVKSPEAKVVVKETVKKVAAKKVAATKVATKTVAKKVVAKKELVKSDPTKTVAKKVIATKVVTKEAPKKVAKKVVAKKK